VKETRRIEILALIAGVLLSVGSLFYGRIDISLSIAVGFVFASINFRLLIWSWEAVIEQQTTVSDIGIMDIIPRFILKYTFLIVGVILAIFALPLHPVGFAIGVGNVFLAIIFYPFLPKRTE